MFAVVLIPEFPLQALLRGKSQAVPAVVVDDAVVPRRAGQRGQSGKAPVIARNPQAVEGGIQLGMTAPQAQARCSGVRVLTRDREEEEAVYQEFLQQVGEHGADLEATVPGVVTMDLFSCPEWQVDQRRAGETMVRVLGRALRMDVVVGVGLTPDQARLAAASAAVSGAMVRLLREGAATVLREEPIELLQPSVSLLEVLRLWGVNTVGQFLRLPREELGHRLGAEAADLWEVVTGKRRRLLQLLRPPQSYRVVSHFDYEIETLEPLCFLLRRGLETLVTRLASQYRVASKIHLVLFLADGTQVQECFRVPDPSNEVDLLYRLVHCRLEALVAKSPVVGIALELTPEPPKKQQFDFFRATLQDPNRFGRTLAELEALLGSERVGSPRALDTHRPDAFQLQPFDRAMEQAVKEQGRAKPPEHDERVSLGVMLGLPLRRCRPPMKVRVAVERHQGVPTPLRLLDGPHRGTVVARRGPWRYSGEWWDVRAWAREEWDVQLHDGALCQLARLGEAWYVEGLYG